MNPERTRFSAAGRLLPLPLAPPLTPSAQLPPRKAGSNDVDLLITYPQEDGKERFVLDRLVKRLQAKGSFSRPALLNSTHNLPPHRRPHPSGGVLSQTNCASLRTTEENRSATLLDALDKALVIFKHPANSTTRPRDIYRRVDLIVTHAETM